MKRDLGHCHFDHGSCDMVTGSYFHNSHLLPLRSNRLSLGKLPLLPLTPTRPRHYCSHSHAHIPKVCAGVQWELGER